MVSLKSKKRQRLSGILANFSQVSLGAFAVNNFFKEGNWIFRLFVALFIIFCILSSVLMEPESTDA